MNKKLIIGCIITVVVIAVIGVGICGFGSYKVSEYIGSNNKSVEEIIGNKLPPGLITIFSMDLEKSSSNYRHMSMLLDFEQGYAIIIMDGPPSKTPQEQAKSLESAFGELKNNQSGVLSGPTNIVINEKTYPSFKLVDNKNPYDPKKMIMVVMDSSKRALIVCYAAKESLYDETTAMKFFKLVKN